MIATPTFDSGSLTDLPSPNPQATDITPPSSLDASPPDIQAAIDAILRDESLAFEERSRRFQRHGDPRNAIEESVLDEIVHLGTQLDQVKKAYLEQIRAHIENAQEDERDHVHEIGSRLFHDRLGHSLLYGTRNALFSEVTTSWPAKAVDPDDPAVLVRKLESSGAVGCRWLRDQWAGLRERLEPKKFWQSQDRFKCVRLLGHQPIHAIDHPLIAQIHFATHALDPSADHPFADLQGEMERPALGVYAKNVSSRFTELTNALPAEQHRQFLLDLVNQKIEELNAKIAKHESATQLIAERTVARRNFDHSADAERLRNFEVKCRNQFFQAIQLYRKIRRTKTAGEVRKPKNFEGSQVIPNDSAVYAGADSHGQNKSFDSNTPTDRAHRSPGRTRTTPRTPHANGADILGSFADLASKRPMEDPETLKPLANAIGEMITELLAESPAAIEYLRPYLPPSIASVVDAASSTDPASSSPAPVDEALKESVRPLGELIRDLLTASPAAAEYLLPYLLAPQGRPEVPENPG
jgi:hypothetical protein